jgi:uncharacterized protein
MRALFQIVVASQSPSSLMTKMLSVNSRLRKMLTMARVRTYDREATPVLTSEQIGPSRAKTPEGFLLCMNVPIARCGTMIYGRGEIPLEPGSDGLIRVTRGRDDLFAPVSLASYQGKPIVDDHPEGAVEPSNWKLLSIGVTLNPREGEGENADCVVADLLITDQHAIRDVDAGKREVSAGYEADYEQTGEGEGKQTNIIGNHVALVEKGRCGPRCAIGDHQPKELKSMGTKNTTVKRRAAIADSIRKAFKDAETGLLSTVSDTGLVGEEDENDENDGGDTHIHIHSSGESQKPESGKAVSGGDDSGSDPVEARFAAIETSIAEIKALLAPKGQPGEGKDGGENPFAKKDGDEEEITAKDGMPDEVQAAIKSTTNDSVALQTSFQTVMADAEILVPGFRFPTFDSKAKRKATMDSMCAARRSVLNHLTNTADGSSLLNSLSGGSAPAIDKMTCVEAATLFRSAAGAKRLLNNTAGTRDAGTLAASLSGAANKPGAVRTLADLNRLHSKYHSAGKASN